jgi:hypothetical protein
MTDININKLRWIAETWRKANSPGSNIDVNKLADDTIKMIDTMPLIKEVCQAFFDSVTIHAIRDKNFDNIVDMVMSKNIKI